MIFARLAFLLVTIVHCSKAVELDSLLGKMDASEKCGQMTQLSLGYFVSYGNDQLPIKENELKEIIRKYKIGSLLNVPSGHALEARTWQRIIELMQKFSKQQTRLKIPLIYGIDSIHGANYIQEAVLFPQPLNLAASFNPEVVERVGEITSIETRAAGIPWNFNPVLDVGRQPLWPRYHHLNLSHKPLKVKEIILL